MELITCCENGLEDKVKELLESNMDPNVEEILCERNYRLHPMRVTPLYAASVNNHIHIVRLLLQHGANPNSYNSHFNLTPLFYAGSRGYIEIVTEFLNNPSTDVNIKCGDNEETLLHGCCIQENTELLKILLKHPGIDVNIKDTPLSIAIRHYLKMDNIELIMNDSRCDVNLLINGAHPLTGIQGEPSFQLQILKLFLDNPNFNPNIGEPTLCESFAYDGLPELMETLLKSPKFDPSYGFESALKKSMFGDKDGTLFIDILLQECSSNITIELAKECITSKHLKYNRKRIYYAYLFCKYGNLQPEDILSKEKDLKAIQQLISSNSQKSALKNKF